MCSYGCVVVLAAREQSCNVKIYDDGCATLKLLSGLSAYGLLPWLTPLRLHWVVGWRHSPAAALAYATCRPFALLLR